jgi:hypothetical protein
MMRACMAFTLHSSRLFPNVTEARPEGRPPAMGFPQRRIPGDPTNAASSRENGVKFRPRGFDWCFHDKEQHAGARKRRAEISHGVEEGAGPTFVARRAAEAVASLNRWRGRLRRAKRRRFSGWDHGRRSSTGQTAIAACRAMQATRYSGRSRSVGNATAPFKLDDFSELKTHRLYSRKTGSF